MTYHKVGVLYHPRELAARVLAESLRDGALSQVKDVWLAATGDEVTATVKMAGTDLLVCVGGDGTVLWAARIAIPHPVHILSVNMGRLGFLSEVDPAHAAGSLVAVLADRGTLEERAMIECTVHPASEATILKATALNDVVVGRAAPGRPVYLSISVNGVHLARVGADAIIVATATGSTAYNLSAGGPLLMPPAQELLLTPVAPHFSRLRPLVLPEDSIIEIQVVTEHLAIMSADGQVDYPLGNGSLVVCRRSPHRARFVRFGPPNDFFDKLAEHLSLSTDRGEGET